MPTYRVEVRPNTTGPTVRSRLYFLRGEHLEAHEVDHLCHEILSDPVTEEYRVSDGLTAHASSTSFIEVTLLPGVTDSAAENLVRSAHALGVRRLERAATGERIEFLEHQVRPELERLAAQTYSNPVIQRFSVNESIMPRFVETTDSSGKVETIIVRGADDARLREISRERRLALDLREMQAVQAYYEGENRDPTDVELEMIAQTWSEHCVHKTFKAVIEQPDGVSVDGLLKTYLAAATKKLDKPWVRSAFVDNAGIIHFDDDYDVAVKVETHNHPSALEPFGGANTGVGGVIRDVLAVGAKPVAVTDVLCFGPLDLENVPEGVLHPKRVMDGVVRGIEDYGNKMGIPTVNGAVFHHPGYTANPLVYCGCVGVLPASERNARPLKATPGDLIVAIGGRTGRDGIRGATFSSLEMDTSTADIAGSSVQIGNPITEKQTQEVILRAKAEGLYSALTDCGAGGFSSAVGEMSEGLGAIVHLERAPLKYPGLQPWEIWLSEAQERMVFAVPGEHLERFEALCRSQDVESVVLGEFTSTGRLRLEFAGQAVGDLDLEFLHDGIPRKQLRADAPSVGGHGHAPLPGINARDALLRLLAHPNIRSREDVIRVYDHEIKGGTAVKPLVGAANHGPSDAAVIVPNPGKSARGLAVSNGICPQFTELDPYAMTFAAVDEAVRNAVAVGADPDRIAILDNFCWGNPNLPDRLGSLLETSRGCHDAALEYGTPFVSGKDSLNNEYTDETGAKHAIPGTLLISAVGIVPDVERTVTMDFKRAGNLIYLLGDTRAELGGSHLALEFGLSGGTVPQPTERPLERMRALHRAIQGGLVQACHDCSEGGLGVAVSEMCLAGRVGANINLETMPGEPLGSLERLYSETTSRFVLEVAPEHAVAFERTLEGQALSRLGKVTNDAQLTVMDAGNVILEVDTKQLEIAWRGELARNTASVGAHGRAPLQAPTSTNKRVLILHANGTNRDHDAALAVELAGGQPEIAHMNELSSRDLERYHMIVVPGGFSYGDDLGAGVLWALDLREHFREMLEGFVQSGRPVIGICNGFQALVKSGILPGDLEKPRQSTLTFNASGHFECRWVTLEPNPNSKSPWVQGLEEAIYTPIAHGEGRFVCDQATLEGLQARGMIALSYAGEGYPANPNGSVAGIAGITNAAGNVLGLMPHPENHVFAWQHPRWHRGERGGSGLTLFRNGLRLA